MMGVCCCSLAGTAACQHCKNNPLATDVRSNVVITDRIDAKPFGNGLDVCPVCGAPSTIGKSQTNADRIRSMTDEELALNLVKIADCGECIVKRKRCEVSDGTCALSWLDWLKQESEL